MSTCESNRDSIPTFDAQTDHRLVGAYVAGRQIARIVFHAQQVWLGWHDHNEPTRQTFEALGLTVRSMVSPSQRDSAQRAVRDAKRWYDENLQSKSHDDGLREQTVLTEPEMLATEEPEALRIPACELLLSPLFESLDKLRRDVEQFLGNDLAILAVGLGYCVEQAIARGDAFAQWMPLPNPPQFVDLVASALAPISDSAATSPNPLFTHGTCLP